ncbi:MAG: Glu-tRNA(Gln) amidotransferase subunit GatE, partial [Nanoarchaeota archaeon]|nr:Glu-tRNA(Gln) amidotransferase subunit GatE [Nanoarchaeota archaeon]
MDYQKIGFKCGLEIHQQLEGKKLFCSCPTLIKDDEPDFIIKRRLRASAGESGDIDIAAKYEQKIGKEFIYNIYNDSNCLVCVDEEPPHDVNSDALKIALEVSMLLNAKIVDEIHFMRKVVIDGSNTSAFQRTALISRDGYIETSKGRVKIMTVCLEEEAAKIIEKKDTYVKYNLSRLGIPLLEIATDASIKDPEHAKEVAEKIGMILRSLNGIKRGIGTIRQDVNVSIDKGARIELKGFQELKSIPLVIKNEVERQLKLIEKEEKIKQ